MSSKKDLLDRMAKQPGAVTRRRREEAPSSDRPKEVETRLASGVIRRRSRKRAAPPPPSSLPGIGGGAAKSEPTPPRTVTRRRPAPPTEPEVAPQLPSLSATEEATPAPTPESTPEPVTPVAEAAPKAEVAATPEAPPAEVKTQAAAPEPAPEAPKASEQKAPEQKAPEPVAVEASTPEPAKPAPEPAPVEKAAVPERKTTRSTRGGAPPRRPQLPGLGSAVVKPPPGYDPNDPLGNRKRAREAAKASTTGGRGSRWSDGRSSTTTTTTGNPTTGAPSRGKTGTAGGPGAGRGGPGGGPGGPGGARRGRRKRGRVQAFMDGGVPHPTRRRRNKKSKGAPKAPSPKPKAQKRKVMVDGTISVRQLAQDMSVQAGQVLKVLINLGVVTNINEQLDFDTASMIAPEFEYEAVNVGFQEDQHLISVDVEDEDENAVTRPPVVTVMGHVDHGKTTLLDAIRKAEVAAGEAGGITQHIGAYQVKRGDELVTFIDTPGHAAFTEMRARGAQATDVVILVVAADDGVMPQTVESINHTKAAGVPIVVAVNKCDKPGVVPDKIRQELMQYELVPEEYGGETLMVNVSALKAQGIDELLDAVLLVSELQELSANPDRHAEGVVLEAKVERGRGAVATMLVKKGTLRAGDPLVLGTSWGKVRAMTDYKGKRIKTAGPSMPVEVIGLDSIPDPGTSFIVAPSEKDAKAIAGFRADEERAQQLSTRQKVTLQDILQSQAAEEVKKLNLIIKGDVQGSIEALKGALAKLEIEGADVNVLHSAVGGVSESDITLASTYAGIVVGFNVRPDAKARRAAEEKEVEVRMYRVIYDVLDDVEKALKGMLEPVREERVQGHAEIRATFGIPKIGTIAGCFVTDGKLARSHNVRLLREGVVVWDGRLASLKRFKDDVREVEKGYECGLGLENFQDIKVGDELETYIIEEVSAY